jgi:GTP-binding protein
LIEIDLSKAKLAATAVSKKDWPENDLPEIAVAGRSNVGKSSLINHILNRKRLAYVGKIPGKTRTINFYEIDERFNLVDLPGYGYAAASKGREGEWTEFVNRYLMERSQLKLVLFLLDVRRKPSDQDIQMAGWLDSYGVDHVICITKTDKLTKTGVRENIRMIRSELRLPVTTEVIETSSLKGKGKQELLEVIQRKVFEQA